MLDFCAACLKLTGKVSLYVIKCTASAINAHPTTVLGGFVLGSGAVVSAYFFGPCFLNTYVYVLDNCTELLNISSECVDTAIRNECYRGGAVRLE